MPLGDHLRAEQDVVPLLAKRRENFLVRELSRRRVPVHAHDTGCRHERLEFRFQLFRARAKVFDVGTRTFGAQKRHGLLDVTVMAQEPAAAMIDERQRAGRTFDDGAARAAHDEGREAAAVQHEDHLLLLRHRFLDELTQRRGDDRAIAAMQFLAHVYTFDMRERSRTDALRHRKERKLAAARAVRSLKRRRSAAQKQYGAMQLRHDLGDGTRMVARRLVLLVRHILLLVEDDESDVLDGCEEC